MSLRGFFVTGTDTGVGKTAVTAALCVLLFRAGLRVAPVKPVQTGVTAGEPGDLEICLETAGLKPGPELLRRMNPYRFRLPASPHLAAEQEGQAVDPELILAGCRELVLTHDCLLVESAGGLLAPLTRKYSTLELAAALGLPLIVVARAALGTLNHTLLTLQAARAAGLNVAAVVLNRPLPGTPDRVERLIERDNRRVIEDTGGVTVLGPLPHIHGAGLEPLPGRELAAALNEAGAESLIRSLLTGRAD
ncbi:dethiobiotin synthase [bacterium]|nr:dethiobiotin synthase [bacterium]